MFFKQIVHRDLGCASYVVGSSHAGECLVVDPRWEIEDYLEVARENSFRIVKIVETHTHADHVSGHGRLSHATGATILVHKDAEVGYPHESLRDGDVLELGPDVRIHVIHTPGHRPEHIALAIEDGSRGADPWMVLSGDSLFVGDIARPDLAVDGREGGGLLFHSLHEKLMRLPEFVAVYPAHVAGSLCGRVSSGVLSTTIGYEKRYNRALAIESREEFIRYTNENLPQRPPNMERIVETNRGPLKIEAPKFRSLTVEEARDRLSRDIVALDVRHTDKYLPDHIPASIHVPLSGPQFGTRAGFVLGTERAIVVVASDAGEARRAAESLAVVAFNNLAGYVIFEEWQRAGEPVASIPTMGVHDLQARLVDGQDVRVIDVREPDEWESGVVSGAIRVPYREVAQRRGEIGSEGLVAVMCQSGSRSAIAVSLLERGRFPELADVAGGIDAWTSAGLPTS